MADGSAIRFPVGLPRPERRTYGDEYEETRSYFEPEIGSPRRRNQYRLAPRLFNLSWEFDLDHYPVFESWFWNGIKGGEREFDIQLLDDDETLVWYTGHLVGEYQADRTDRYWYVSAKFRTIKPSFANRPPRTDELGGETSIEFNHLGALEVTKALGGLGVLSFEHQLNFKVEPLAGVGSVEFFNKGQMLFFPFRGVGEISFQHQGELLESEFSCPDYDTVELKYLPIIYSAPAGGSTELKFLPCTYTPPEVT